MQAQIIKIVTKRMIEEISIEEVRAKLEEVAKASLHLDTSPAFVGPLLKADDLSGKQEKRG